jgi:putative PIN family toxin of toxin-antitoxin system
MENGNRLRVVLDTNVIFEGLTKRKGACGIIIDAWLAGLIRVYVSDELVYEYADVLSRKLSTKKWERAKIVLATLLQSAQFVALHYTWRPSSPDPADDKVIDCAMNVNAIIVTSNLKDFRKAEKELGAMVVTPLQLVQLLAV